MSSQNGKNGPWFAVSMLLTGVIVGFVAANVLDPTLFGTQAKNQPAVNNGQAAPAPVAAPTAPPSADNVPAISADDHIRGNSDAAIAVIEYSDFECPFCKSVHGTYQQLVEENDDVMWVYRHFPLTSIHPNAQKAAEGSECVTELGGNDAFWQYADIVFSQGSETSKLTGYAEEIGLDRDAFQSCLDSGKYAEKVNTQMQGGADAGVRGTPGNIVMNVETGKTSLISGAQPATAFQSAIESLK